MAVDLPFEIDHHHRCGVAETSGGSQGGIKALLAVFNGINLVAQFDQLAASILLTTGESSSSKIRIIRVLLWQWRQR